MTPFSVIGAGRVGANLVYALEAAGFPLIGVFRKSPHACYESRVIAQLSDLLRPSSVIAICVQESKLAAVVAEIAECTEPIAGKTFFHVSNSLTAAELAPLKAKGALTASFSPLQTFPRFAMSADIFRGIYFIGEGDSEALTLTEILAGALKARFVRVSPELKVYFHIAAVFASNFFAGLMTAAENQLNHAISPATSDVGFPVSILLPLVRQTLENIEKYGPAPAISGPVRRGQGEIIQKHLSLLTGKEKEIYLLMSDFLAETLGIPLPKA